MTLLNWNRDIRWARIRTIRVRCGPLKPRLTTFIAAFPPKAERALKTTGNRWVKQVPYVCSRVRLIINHEILSDYALQLLEWVGSADIRYSGRLYALLGRCWGHVPVWIARRGRPLRRYQHALAGCALSNRDLARNSNVLLRATAVLR